MLMMLNRDADPATTRTIMRQPKLATRSMLQIRCLIQHLPQCQRGSSRMPDYVVYQPYIASLRQWDHRHTPRKIEQ